jgi:hypothetical protein
MASTLLFPETISHGHEAILATSARVDYRLQQNLEEVRLVPL